MLVRQSTHDRVVRELDTVKRQAFNLLREFNALADKWNKIADKINNDGLVPAGSQFTPEELDALVRLCHPDKHGGSRAANDMTAKLLAMRKKT